MEKPVIISIKGIQIGECIGEERMEFVIPGTLEETEGGYSLRYRETEITGMEGTTTTFQVGKDRIVLLREGTFHSEMIFQVGHKHLTAYDTPYGGVALGVDTKIARSDLNKDGGNLYVQYHLDIENETVGKNIFEVHVSSPRLPSLQE